MCGRFGVEKEYVQLALRYQAVVGTIDPGPRYNVAPTDPAAVIIAHDGERFLTHHRWGLIPSWAKDRAIGARMINARAETVATQPAFRDALGPRRCIIPATRFYEWRRNGAARIPFSIHHRDGAPMSFAGLWDTWTDRATGEQVPSCTIITTAANDFMSSLHNRMPVILDDEGLARWLDPAVDDMADLLELLVPCPDDVLATYQVSQLVNNVRNDGPELIQPPEPVEELDAQLHMAF